MKNRRLLPLLLLTALSACLENEEEVEVRPDGSVRVSVAADGDLADLAGGYPVPLAGPWTPRGPDAQRWLRDVGPDTGSDAVQERAGRAAWPREPNGDAPKATLRATATFASVADWPRWFAPADDPYRTAYLQRSATLSVEERGARTVYVFERTYHGRAYARLNAQERAEARLPEGLREKLDAKQALSDGEWASVSAIVREEYGAVAEHFVRDACLGLYTEGNASLAPEALDRVCRDVRRAVGGAVDLGEVIRFYEFVIQATEKELDAYEGDDPLKELETRTRDALRSALETALVQEGLAEPLRNGVRFALEWGFTAFDHAGDLADEKFRVAVAMPGRIVGGNYDGVEEGKARWSFEGKELRDRDRVLRVVSVLE